MSEVDSGWVARWVVALCEPLVDTDSRIEIDARMVDLASRRPHWYAAWLSGFLSAIVQSLDPEDPWRNLQVVNNQTVHPNESPFGTWVDATDLVYASVEDIRADLGLAALEKPLSADSAELLTVAAQGWDATLTWCERRLVTATRLGPSDGEALFKTTSAAVRWAVHRRRLFSGMEDPFIHTSGVAWTARADKLTSGESWDEARAARHLEANKVQPGTYRQFNPQPE